jgi:hypothetical protein
VCELVREGEALSLDIDPVRDHDRLADRLAAPDDVTSQTIDALGEVVYDHLDTLVFKQFAQAGNGIQAKTPRLAEFIGPGVDLAFSGDAVVTPAFHPLDVSWQVQDVLDCEIALKVIDQNCFGHRQVTASGLGVLPELKPLQGLDLSTHEEIE